MNRETKTIVKSIVQRTIPVALGISLIFMPIVQDSSLAIRRGHGGSRHAGGPHRHPHPHPHPHPHVHMRVWHPIGFTLTVLATTAIVVSIADGSSGGSSSSDAQSGSPNYYYDSGTFYEKQGDVYVVVKAQVGVVVPSLPDGYENTSVGGKQYYYYAGDFYANHNGKYIVADAPVGAEVSSLPQGYKEEGENGQTYYTYDGVWYEPVTSGDNVSYEVTAKP